MNYGIINTIEDDLFVHPNGFAFDFKSKADITFIMFLGNISKKYFNVKQRLDYWKKQIKRDTKIDVNVVIIGDIRENDLYIANYTGIDGICNSVWELSKILLDIIYTKQKTKRTVVFADCGGSIPAALSSSVVPYHSMTLTTPYFTILGSENEFDTSQFSMWFARELSINIYNNLSEYKQYFDILDYCDRYIQNSNQMLNLHWATNIIGTDLLFRNRANLLPKKMNLIITDHFIPLHIEGHMLSSYLFSTRKYQKLIAEQIDIQKKILDNNNK
jgi:hypothetical protein